MTHHGPNATVDFPLPPDAPVQELPIYGYSGDPPEPSFLVTSRMDRIQLFKKVQECAVSVAVDQEPFGYHLRLNDAPDSDEVLLAFDGTTWYKRTVPQVQANLGDDCLIEQCEIDEGLRLSLEALTQ